MTTLDQWAARWGVPAAAVAELMGVTDDTRASGNEASVVMLVRQEAAQKGGRLWRNNVGAMQDQSGRWVRYGIANDSKAVNERVKSADLIGIRPLRITPAHVGAVVGQFLSRECKAPGWKYTGTPREEAQVRWATLVRSLGGDATFATGTGTI